MPSHLGNLPLSLSLTNIPVYKDNKHQKANLIKLAGHFEWFLQNSPSWNGEKNAAKSQQDFDHETSPLLDLGRWWEPHCFIWKWMCFSVKLTAFSHLKMDGWNMLQYDRFVLGWPIFRGRTVSFRECKSGSPKIDSLEDGVPFQLGDTYLKHPLVFGAAKPPTNKQWRFHCLFD